MNAFPHENLTFDFANDDIHNVAELLGLPRDAFHGSDGEDPRQQVLKSIGSIDVAACPGSGKTTLLVAKLALLAKRWENATSGLCVLSHTNVAREEIEGRLGHTMLGAKLLTYPHYIGTIHSFINQFLALPWMRSKGFRVLVVDDEICQRRRWGGLPQNIKYGLEQREIRPADLVLADLDFNVNKSGGSLGFGRHTPTYRELVRVFRETAEEGYFCFNDMFLYAREFIDRYPEIVSLIRHRFPLLLIDEAQDTTPEQASLLHRVFMADGNPVVRQRFGDGNQAIFDVSRAENRTEVDSFPGDGVTIKLANSFRFGSAIARLSDPLGLVPYRLSGQGPKYALKKSGDESGPNTIFLFDEESIGYVVHTFGELVMDTFSESELTEGQFAVIGHIHNPAPDPNNEPFARHIGHYWRAYDAQRSSRNSRPIALLQHVHIAASLPHSTGDASEAVDMFAGGVLRLGVIGSGNNNLYRPSRQHQHLLELLEQAPHARKVYLEMLASVVLKGSKPLSAREWRNQWVARMKTVAEAVTAGALDQVKVGRFLSWRMSEPEQGALEKNLGGNIYAMSSEESQLHMQFGSVHSVKGREFAGVLVLETYWYTYGLEDLLPWLAGRRDGADNTIRRDYRLKVHYVAMTRPTHLLCLGMRRSSFEDESGELNDKLIGELQARGWHVHDLASSRIAAGVDKEAPHLQDFAE